MMLEYYIFSMNTNLLVQVKHRGSSLIMDHRIYISIIQKLEESLEVKVKIKTAVNQLTTYIKAL